MIIWDIAKFIFNKWNGVLQQRAGGSEEYDHSYVDLTWKKYASIREKYVKMHLVLAPATFPRCRERTLNWFSQSSWWGKFGDSCLNFVWNLHSWPTLLFALNLWKLMPHRNFKDATSYSWIPLICNVKGQQNQRSQSEMSLDGSKNTEKTQPQLKQTKQIQS